MRRGLVACSCVLFAAWSALGCGTRRADPGEADVFESLPNRPQSSSRKADKQTQGKSLSSDEEEQAANENAFDDAEPARAEDENNAEEPAGTNKGKSKGRAPPSSPMDSNDREACAEPRVSYAKPCHDDPDPCGLNSGWSGDEYCWPAPPDGEGIQMHIGPKNYTDSFEVAKYVMHPGEEFNDSVLSHVPLTGQRWYNRIMVRIRPGSHHWVANLVTGRPEERVYPEADQNCGAESAISQFGGGQNLIYDNPPGGVAAPENEGLGSSLPGNSSLCINLHAYNFSDQPQLREMWINVYFVDESEVTQKTETIGVVAGLGLSVAPGSSQTLSYARTFNGTGRIIQLFGHRHIWTPHFAVWLNNALVFDSWSWQESVTFNYDSITENPPLMPDMKVDGALSGPLEVKAGDQLTFSCFIVNDSDRTLTWRNELREGEMCNLWGTTVGPKTGLSGDLQ